VHSVCATRHEAPWAHHVLAGFVLPTAHVVWTTAALIFEMGIGLHVGGIGLQACEHERADVARRCVSRARRGILCPHRRDGSCPRLVAGARRGWWWRGRCSWAQKWRERTARGSAQLKTVS
jgi:hypothetical protein